MIIKDGPEGFAPLLDGIRLKNLTHGATTHLTKVKLAKGAIIPEHRHPHEQTGYLLSGKVRFFSGDDQATALPGDCWSFPGEAMHGAEALEESVVLGCFSPIREDYLALSS